MELFKIFLALALLAIFSNPTFAEEFDPVGDLYSEDALLNLDLPADFEEENSVAEESATPVFEFPPDETETSATAPANNIAEIEIGSGGAIEDYSSEEESPPVKSLAPQTSVPPIFFEDEENMSAPRFAPEQQDVLSEVSSFFYDSTATIDLSSTGPEAAFSITLLLTLPAAWIFKRKFLNV
ncbi:hypothetical protein KKF38_02445 [Patescibacteria group bacterium]|nr:hypothetical protein [Patescibacteria group bacterium]